MNLVKMMGLPKDTKILNVKFANIFPCFRKNERQDYLQMEVKTSNGNFIVSVFTDGELEVKKDQ